MKKPLIILSSLFLIATMTGCNSNKENHTPGAVSDKTTQSEDVKTSDSQGESEAPNTSENEPVSEIPVTKTLPQLNVYLYTRYVPVDTAALMKGQFTSYLATQGVAITNLVWEGAGASDTKVSDFSALAEKYDGGHADAKIDVILGAKANFDSADNKYVNDNFSTLNGSDENPIEMTIGEKNDRRIWIRNDSANMEAVRYLVLQLVNIDIDEESEETSESEVESVSENTPVISENNSEEEVSENNSEVVSENNSEVSSENTSEAEGLVLPQLSVYMFSASVDSDCNDALKGKFNKYLQDNNITITSLTWEFSKATKVIDLNGEIENYDKEHADATVDVILGGKAYKDCTYINDNFSSMRDDDGNFYQIVTTKDGAETTERRFWQRNNSSNKDAVLELVLALVAE